MTAPARVLPRLHLAAPMAGLAAASALGLASAAVGSAFPVIGAPVIAVTAGVLLSGGARRLGPGLDLARTSLLQLSVVLLGAQLSLGEVLTVGAGSLPVLLGTLSVCLVLAWALGRRLGVARDLRTLIGVGTAICGASAIGATAPAIRAKSTDIAYAISTIFVCNVAAVVVFPPLGHLLGLSQHAFGLFAGTAVNDTSSVVAAAGSYGAAAARYAVIVKLTRTLMIIPVVLTLTTLTVRRASAVTRHRTANPEPATHPNTTPATPSDAGSAIQANARPATPPGAKPATQTNATPATQTNARSATPPKAKPAVEPTANPQATLSARLRQAAGLVPWFLVGFLVVAGLHSLGAIPTPAQNLLHQIALLFIAIALAAIGLSADLASLRRTGARPLVLGVLLWITVAATSLGLQALSSL